MKRAIVLLSILFIFNSCNRSKIFDAYVAFENNTGETIFRKDADIDEIKRMKNDPDGYCKVWREFNYSGKPTKWVVWPHSISKGWCNKIEGNL